MTVLIAVSFSKKVKSIGDTAQLDQLIVLGIACFVEFGILRKLCALAKHHQDKTKPALIHIWYHGTCPFWFLSMSFPIRKSITVLQEMPHIIVGLVTKIF